jgi:hypothetical protein
MLRRTLIWTLCCLVALALVGGSYILGARSMGTRRVSAEDGLPAIDPAAPEATSSTFTCNINQVAVWENRIHVRCSPANGNIAYFAYATDPLHGAQANRYLALADTAYALGHRLVVGYWSDSMANPPSCNANDCRKITALTMVP